MITTTRTGPVTVLTIERPEAANALDTRAREQLATALGDAESDPEVRALVLTGAGARMFCAGMDLTDVPEDLHLIEGPAARLARVDLPVVAAVNGAAVGGGFELALACDMVVAAEHARFWLPEVSRAIVPADGGTRLAQRIPLALAMELVLTGERLDAQRAHALGLVNRVVSADDVVDVATDLARATCEGAPLAVAHARSLVRRSLTDDDTDLRRAEADAIHEVLSSEDLQEGSRAFLEKRPPRWTGR